MNKVSQMFKLLPGASVWAQVGALWLMSVWSGRELGSWAVLSNWRWGYVEWSCTAHPLVLSPDQKCLTAARSRWCWLPGQPSPLLGRCGQMTSSLCPPLHHAPRPGWGQACWPATLTPGDKSSLELLALYLVWWPVNTLLYSYTTTYNNLYGLGPLYQIASHKRVVEDSAESPSHTECYMKKTPQHWPVEGHQGGHHVLYCHVLYLFHLLFQALRGQHLRTEGTGTGQHLHINQPN